MLRHFHSAVGAFFANYDGAHRERGEAQAIFRGLFGEVPNREHDAERVQVSMHSLAPYVNYARDKDLYLYA